MVHFLGRLENLLHVLLERQGRQVHHHADADAGAHVRGAGCEVAVFGAHGIGQPALQRLVHLCQRAKCAVDIKARLDPLQPQVVFLIDHDAEHLAAPENHSPRTLGGGQFAADQVALHQYVAVDLRHFVDAQLHHALLQVDALQRLKHRQQQFFALLRRRAQRERPCLDVAGQAHPRRHYDVALRALAFEPFAQRAGKVIEGRQCLHGPSLRALPGLLRASLDSAAMRSRNWAARS